MSERTKAAEDFDHIRKRLEEIRVLEGREPPKGWPTPSQLVEEAGSPIMGYAQLNAFVIKNWAVHELRQQSPSEINDLFRIMASNAKGEWRIGFAE